MRLTRDYEDDMVERWPRFVRGVRDNLLPQHSGVMVKSLGDGMLLGFEHVADAVACGLALHHHIGPFNDGQAAEAVIWLRAGLHLGDVVCEDFDWFGSAVNIAARLAALAQPGCCVASADIRDQLTPGLDAEFDDLGECFLKHQPEPVRCYQLREVQSRPPSPAGVRPLAVADAAEGLATLAIVPFDSGAVTPTESSAECDAERAFGDAIADALISAFSTRRDWRVLARLSTAAFRGRGLVWTTMRRALHATYAVTGHYKLRGEHADVTVDVHDVRRQAQLWQGHFRVMLAELFAGDSHFVGEVTAAATRAISDHELRCAQALPVPTLDDYSLYAGGVTLMNRLSVLDFNRAHDLFSQLQDRAPRAASPHAMVARWHVLCMAQGWSRDRVAQSVSAQAAASRALQLQPQHAFALCVDGLRCMHAEDSFATAEQRFAEALEADPHEPAAWTWLAGLHAYRDNGDAAVAAAEHAIALSPLDPTRFSMDAYYALALLVAERYEESIEACRSAIRRNASLGASYRTLTQALALAGREREAREVMQRLMAIEPHSKVSSYRRVYPGRHAAHMERFVEALRIAGLPD